MSEESRVVSFAKFPTMPSFWDFEADCGAWEAGDYIAIMAKNPAYLAIDYLEATAKNSKMPPPYYSPKKYGIKYHYVMLLYWKQGRYTINGKDSARPARIFTIESVFVGNSYWDTPVLCEFNSSIRANSGKTFRNLTEDVAKEVFLQRLRWVSDEEPVYIGTANEGAARAGRSIRILGETSSGGCLSVILSPIIFAIAITLLA